MSNQMNTIFIHILNKDKENMIRAFCEELNVDVKNLSGADLDNRLISIVSGENKNDNNISPVSILQNDELPELVIFSRFDDDSLKIFLEEYKKRGIEKIALKAMVTPYNLVWTLRELIEHLKEEHSRIYG